MTVQVHRAVVLLTGGAFALGALGATDTSAHDRFVAKPTPAEKQAARYVERGVLKAENGPSCAPGPYPATFAGPPPKPFRSILKVLRGGPRPVPHVIERSFGHEVGLYVNYVRLARVVGGLDYYLYVSDGSVGMLPPGNVARCLSAERADVSAELPSIPAALRPTVEKILATQLKADRRIDGEPVREGVYLVGLNHVGAGGGGGGASAVAVEAAVGHAKPGGQLSDLSGAEVPVANASLCRSVSAQLLPRLADVAL
jgi:hypothetical protein